MAQAVISVSDWELAVGRITATEQGLTLEKQERGQLLAALRTEFTAARGSFDACHAQLEELRVQVEALRATAPGGAAGPGGAALLDPRMLDRPKPFHGKQDQWKDWSEAFRAFIEVVDPNIAEAMKEAEGWTTTKLVGV